MSGTAQSRGKPRCTNFQRRVYAAVRTIPRGRVTTYALLALHLGCGSARAAGQALRRNPFAPRVPCHRVIAADLGPGGFNGQTDGSELRRKLQLLAAEGVVFANGRLAEPARLYGFRPRAAGCAGQSTLHAATYRPTASHSG